MPWCRGIMVTATTQLLSAKPKLKFCAGSNPACGVPEICENLHGESHDGVNL